MLKSQDTAYRASRVREAAYKQESVQSFKVVPLTKTQPPSVFHESTSLHHPSPLLSFVSVPARSCLFLVACMSRALWGSSCQPNSFQQSAKVLVRAPSCFILALHLNDVALFSKTVMCSVLSHMDSTYKHSHYSKTIDSWTIK